MGHMSKPLANASRTVNAGSLARTEGRLGRALAGWALLEGMSKTGKGWWDRHQSERVYTVSIDDEDDIYADLHSWLLSLMPRSEQRSVSVETQDGRRNEFTYSADDGSTPTPKPRALRVFYDGGREQTVTLSGHRVKVQVHQPKGGGGGDGRYAQPEKMIFTCQTEAGRDAVLEFLLSIVAARKTERVPAVYIADRSGDFQRRTDLPARRADSVILRAGQLDGLIDDMDRFIAAEQMYVDMGVPWHRGYLFYGPPGTGKTSLAKTLTARFGFDLYCLPLTDVERDTNLLQLVSRVKNRSVLLLEDIDVLYGATHRDNEGPKGVTLSGLLNSLDGAMTPHGLITILTSNDESKLDDALIRPGRVARMEKVDYCDQEQFDGLIARFAPPGTPYSALKADTVSPALVVEAILRHLHDPDALDEALQQVATYGTLPSLTSGTESRT